MLFFKFVFKRWSVSKQVSYIKKRGTMFASRKKNGRLVYIYMFRDLFAEIVFRDDDPEKEAENLLVINGLKKLNQHLEKETKFF